MDSSPSSVAVGGGFQNDNVELLDTPILSSNPDNGFKRLKTIPVFSVHLLISTTISLTGIILAFVWPPEKRCEAYFIMLYLRATFWVITLIFDHIVKRHHENLRLNGYHDFYRATNMHKGVPLYIVSLWNSALLAVQALMHYYYGDDFGKHCLADYFSPIFYINAFNIVETIILSLVHGSYIAKVHKFNRSAKLPDALRGMDNASGSLGLMQPGGGTAELLEKQADLIAYLRDHTQKLNEKLHQMQLNARTINLTH